MCNSPGMMPVMPTRHFGTVGPKHRGYTTHSVCAGLPITHAEQPYTRQVPIYLGDLLSRFLRGQNLLQGKVLGTIPIYYSQ